MSFNHFDNVQKLKKKLISEIIDTILYQLNLIYKKFDLFFY